MMTGVASRSRVMLIHPLRIAQILRLSLNSADNVPRFVLRAALRLPRHGEGVCFHARLAQRVALAVRAAGFRKASREASSPRAILEATGDGRWRSSLGDRRTAFWPLGDAQNWRQAPPN